MITLLLSILSSIIIILLSPGNRIWPNSIFWSSLIPIITIILIPPLSSLTNISWGLTTDTISTPLIYLSAWLIPVSLLASGGHLSNNSFLNQKIFIILIFIILFFLVVTFTANNFIALFLGFEGTLIPTLFLITNWGAQQERIEAGLFFVFYTLISSLPLFIGLLYLNSISYNISIFYLKTSFLGNLNPTIAFCCMVAFLVKVPIFSLHIWLPKAHVEAPVAGSMILAAILLKMGGYGFTRLIILFFDPFNNHISNILVPFCIWGGLLTSLICLTQTDLKSLIAYSSVSHMSFMVAGISTLSNWAIAGGLIIMIAHGVVSSALFCIANTFYERTSTRNLFINRSTKIIFAITPSLWLIFACANMGLPPLPNAIGEIITVTAIAANNIFNYLPTLIGIVTTGIFSLFMFLAINSGNHQKWSNISGNMNEREHNVIAAHLLPLIVLILSPNLITPWPV
uniref:NADH-ubiquinone oxidoreductase chain 4 n=1 Tax=Ophiothrix scotiosa TaxID=3135525 RepID=A0AAU6PX36_9ECHI